MTMQFFCGGPTTIEENVNAALRIYPQPTSDFLIVETESTAQKIEILSSNGSLISISQVNGKRNQLDVSGLAAGLYFIRVYTEQGCTVQRFIRN
jgi:hypothetical protein